MENNFTNQNIVPKRNLPRDVFLHLFAMVTLYWSAISFITLCWQYINHFFPDALPYYGGGGFTSTIRFAIASLVIVFPFFIVSSWFLNKIYKKESVVRESKMRKWLIYLTLFITSLVIIGDLVSVINTFLNGEITARFILKAFSIIVVAVVIFWYYLDDVRRQSPSPSAKYFAWVSGAIVLAAIVGAFFIIGSPMNAREVQFDQQRVNDLGSIQSQVVNYWQGKGTLPGTLADLNDSISGYTVPNDPQTSAPYEYTIKNAAALTFELCANFKTAANPINGNTLVTPGDVYSQSWSHPMGHYCFERTIDPQRYPVLPKK
jgi:hypothetical protein